MAVLVNTGRGPYVLGLAPGAETDADEHVLTLALERTDGIERFAIRCRVSPGIQPPESAEAMITRIGVQIGRDFETIREAALKSIRTERKLFEITLAPVGTS